MPRGPARSCRELPQVIQRRRSASERNGPVMNRIVDRRSLIASLGRQRRRRQLAPADARPKRERPDVRTSLVEAARAQVPAIDHQPLVRRIVNGYVCHERWGSSSPGNQLRPTRRTREGKRPNVAEWVASHLTTHQHEAITPGIIGQGARAPWGRDGTGRRETGPVRNVVQRERPEIVLVTRIESRIASEHDHLVPYGVIGRMMAISSQWLRTADRDLTPRRRAREGEFEHFSSRYEAVIAAVHDHAVMDGIEDGRMPFARRRGHALGLEALPADTSRERQLPNVVSHDVEVTVTSEKDDAIAHWIIDSGVIATSSRRCSQGIELRPGRRTWVRERERPHIISIQQVVSAYHEHAVAYGIKDARRSLTLGRRELAPDSHVVREARGGPSEEHRDGGDEARHPRSARE